MQWEWLAWCLVLKLSTGRSVCKNCGECMEINKVTLHRGAASGAVSVKEAICIRTWCIYQFASNSAVTNFPKNVQEGLADQTGLPAHANKATVNGTFSPTWLAHLLLRKLIVEIEVG